MKEISLILISMNLISATWMSAPASATHCINTIIVHKYSSTFNIGGIVARKFREETAGRVQSKFYENPLCYLPLILT